MLILALDTSGPVCSVALLENDTLLYEARAINRLTHSRNLMPMVDEAFGKAGMEISQVALIAAVAGPGSFTGVRIGIAAAQGMASGLEIPCIAINALEAMAASLLHTDAVVCPIRDARAQQVYGAAFHHGKRMMEDDALPIGGYLDKVSALEPQLLFIGDGVAPCKQAIIDKIGQQALFAPAHLLLPGAGAVAYLASINQHNAVKPGELKPLYLRAPQAERMQRNQTHGG